MHDWSAFVPYGGQHAVTVTACLAVIALVVRAGRTAGSREKECRLRRAIAVFGLVVWVVYNTAWNWTGIDVEQGLPLQLCDIAGVLAPLALLTLNPWLRAAQYFWAMVLTSQAFIQPTVTQGPSHVLFWGFWVAHTVVLGCAVYDLAVLRFRPGPADLGRAYAFSVLYLAVVVPVNAWLGSNYGYVGNPPPGRPIPPFVALLGPWPGRAVVLVVLAALGFAVALLPWAILARRRPPGPAFRGSP